MKGEQIKFIFLSCFSRPQSYHGRNVKVFYAFGHDSGVGNAVSTALQSHENRLGSVSSS